MAASWVYFDETAHEETVNGRRRFRDMIVGGCKASNARWEAFSGEWRKALDAEGVRSFHGKHFFSFNGEFRWHKDGKKDIERHQNFCNRLIQIILDHVDEINGYCSAADEMEKKPVRVAYRVAMANAFRTIARDWGEELYIVFARHPEVSPWSVMKLFEQMSWSHSLKGCGVFEPDDVLPLQAADFILHATLQRWRNIHDDKVFNALRNGARERGIAWKLHIGSTFQPFGAPKSPPF